MSSTTGSIKPNPPRWSPSSDPASIVIPGLDTDASTADQIEQIEQLITIKLQNIDENFAKIHNVLANKLLPAVKRYAVGTEPVREAAKFWTSFYEAAAQIRIPTFDDYSTVNEVPSEREEGESSSQEQGEVDGYEEESTMTRPRQEIYETSAVNSETSFLPGQGAFSSTPAMARQTTTMTVTDLSYASQGSDDPSWTPSMESPLVRLNRELNNFSNESNDDSIIPSTSGLPRPGTITPASAAKDDYDESSDFTFQQTSAAAAAAQPPRSEKGKGKSKETGQPLLKNVLRHNLYSASDNSSFENNTAKLSPSKFRGKPNTPTIDKNLNPYLRANSTANNNNTTTNTSNWSGIVDLRDRSILTPQRNRSAKKTATTTTTTTPYGNAGRDDDDDDSFDALPPGMSPPVLMSPARPPRSSAELGLLKLGQTPARDASARIQRDLLRDALKSGGGGGGANTGRRLSTFPKYEESSSMSTVSGTPPSLSQFSLNRYHHPQQQQHEHDYSTSSSSNMTKDSSLESMIRHIRSDIQPNVGMTPGMTPGRGSTPGLRLRPRVPAQTQAQAQAAPARAYEEETPPPAQHRQTYFDTPSSEPATPMYVHQHHQHQEIDDGDLSSDSDSLDDEINNTAHPSAAFLMASQRASVDDDDSFGSSNHSSDSLNDDDVGGAVGEVPVHPFAGVVGGVVDDGFDDEDDDESFDGFDNGMGDLHARGGGQGGYQGEEETVFGVGPGVRQYAAAAGRQGQGRGRGQGQSDGNGLRMLGEDLLQDTIGIGSHIAATGRVEESPTPASWAHT